MPRKPTRGQRTLPEKVQNASQKVGAVVTGRAGAQAPQVYPKSGTPRVKPRRKY